MNAVEVERCFPGEHTLPRLPWAEPVCVVCRVDAETEAEAVYDLAGPDVNPRDVPRLRCGDCGQPILQTAAGWATLDGWPCGDDDRPHEPAECNVCGQPVNADDASMCSEHGFTCATHDRDLCVASCFEEFEHGEER